MFCNSSDLRPADFAGCGCKLFEVLRPVDLTSGANFSRPIRLGPESQLLSFSEVWVESPTASRPTSTPTSRLAPAFQAVPNPKHGAARRTAPRPRPSDLRSGLYSCSHVTEFVPAFGRDELFCLRARVRLAPHLPSPRRALGFYPSPRCTFRGGFDLCLNSFPAGSKKNYAGGECAQCSAIGRCPYCKGERPLPPL